MSPKGNDLKKYGYLALAVYIACIPAANWFIQHVGTQAFPGGPHTIPVGFGYQAPSGVLWIGLALVVRDAVQGTLGRTWVIGAIAVGAVLSYFVAPSLAYASAVAFGLGELADFAVYTPLARKRLYLAVAASGVVGAVVDSWLFLWLAGFLTYDLWVGNTLGKVWMSLAALPVLFVLRRRIPKFATA